MTKEERSMADSLKDLVQAIETYIDVERTSGLVDDWAATNPDHPFGFAEDRVDEALTSARQKYPELLKERGTP